MALSEVSVYAVQSSLDQHVNSFAVFVLFHSYTRLNVVWYTGLHGNGDGENTAVTAGKLR